MGQAERVKPMPSVDWSPEAAAYVRDHGGEVYVWTERQVCCRGRTTSRAQAALSEPTEREFRCVFYSDDLACYLATGLRPKEITLALSSFPRRRVVAFWPGCLHG